MTKFGNRNIAPSNLKQFITRLEQLVGVKLRKKVKENLHYFFDRRIFLVADPVSLEDIEFYEPRIKRFPFLHYVEGSFSICESFFITSHK
jgi:hypothetical protein